MVFKMVVVGNICNAFAVDLSRLPNFAKLSLAGDGVRIQRFRLKEKTQEFGQQRGFDKSLSRRPVSKPGRQTGDEVG